MRFEYLEQALDMFYHLDIKTYGAHFIDSIIGYPEHLDPVFDTFRHINTKNFGAKILESILGDHEKLDYAL